jgi:hypothetical protein
MTNDNTVTVKDAVGNEIEVEVGADGKNPVNPNNPPLKALPPEYREDAKKVVKENEGEVDLEKAAKSTGDYDFTAQAESLPDVHLGTPGVKDSEEEPKDEVLATGDGSENEASGDGSEDEKKSEDTKPSTTASKADWVDYAVSQGMSREEAEDKTKAELIDTYKDA